ncbi:MAG: TetR/AcrR family transcriptional regulator [Dehalococcoidia bacterium]|nr:TetR/AcrR family transcriptional regulator [Dehalococcoidia bacterium]
MPKVTQQYLDTRRQQILDAAIICFSKNGFHKTTMQDIYRECGLSPGALYRYFASKDDIIAALCDDAQRREAQAFQAALAHSDTMSGLNELISQFFGPLQGRKARSIASMWAHIWAEEARQVSLGHAWPEDHNLALKALSEFVRRAQARNEVNPALDPEGVARVMVSLYSGFFLQLASQRHVDVASYAAAIRALFVGHFWVATPHPGGDPKRTRPVSRQGKARVAAINGLSGGVRAGRPAKRPQPAAFLRTR